MNILRISAWTWVLFQGLFLLKILCHAMCVCTCWVSLICVCMFGRVCEYKNVLISNEFSACIPSISDGCFITLLYKAFYLSRCLTYPQVPHSLTQWLAHSLTETHCKVIFRRTVSWSLRTHKSCYLVHMLLTKFIAARLVLYMSFEELYEWTYHIYHMISSLIYVAYTSMYLGVCMEVL